MLGSVNHNIAQLSAAALVVATVTLFRIRSGATAASRRWPLHALAIVIVAGAVGAAYHSASDDGLISHYERVRAVRLNALPQERVPRVDLSEVLRSADDRSATFIDARGTLEFDSGRIDSAVNVPPDLMADQIRARLANVPRDRPLIVYCSRESCETADVLASRLARDGFTNVRVFSGGWEIWVAATRPSSDVSK